MTNAPVGPPSQLPESASGALPDPLPLRPWRGPVRLALGLPGSKSLTLRDCAIAALADGPSSIRFPGEGDDYWRMKDCLRRLGIGIDDSQPGLAVVHGRGGDLGSDPVELFTGQSAVSTRLLLAMAALRPAPTSFDAHPSMRARPNGPLAEALRRLGAEVQTTRDGYLPMRVRGSRELSGPVEVAGDISSQFLTSLLIVAPLLRRGLTIAVQGTLTSRPYVDLTLQEMARFGVGVDNRDHRELRVPPGAYAARTLSVEGDASAASYFAALAMLHGGRVEVENLGRSTLQGDYAFFELCERLGATVRRGEDRTEIVGPEPGLAAAPGASLPGPVDMSPMPDVAPTLMMLAPFLSGKTRIVGLATLRVKECDRIAAPARELRKLGVTVEEGPDSIEISELDASGRGDAPVEIDTYDDHRIAMSFGVLGSVLPGLRIRDPGCVAKTYPGFWGDWERCRPASRGGDAPG